MVPPDSFSTPAPQSSSAFCSGCDAGTQCDSFSSQVLSCASAGVTLTVNSANRGARSVFLIDIVSLVTSGLKTLLQILLYDIIIIASRRRITARDDRVKGYKSQGSKYCG